MQFSILSLFTLAPLAFAISPYGSSEQALLARDISSLKSELAGLERRFVASYEGNSGLSARSFDDEDIFGLSARSYDDDDLLEMLIARAYSATPSGSERLRPVDQVSHQSINRIDTALGNFRNGHGRSTEDKQRTIERQRGRSEATRPASDRYYG